MHGRRCTNSVEQARTHTSSRSHYPGCFNSILKNFIIISLKKNIDIQQGLSKDQCKELNMLIKETKLKIQSQSQGDSLRVNAKKKDDLQEVMKVLKEKDLSFDLQFTNYR